jgi:hypothetical protein
MTIHPILFVSRNITPADKLARREQEIYRQLEEARARRATARRVARLVA